MEHLDCWKRILKPGVVIIALELNHGFCATFCWAFCLNLLNSGKDLSNYETTQWNSGKPCVEQIYRNITVLSHACKHTNTGEEKKKNLEQSAPFGRARIRKVTCTYKMQLKKLRLWPSSLQKPLTPQKVCPYITNKEKVTCYNHSSVQRNIYTQS